MLAKAKLIQVERTAFTIAEALMAGTILAIVSATATLPFAAGLQQNVESARLEQAVALGQAMMEEILARPFTDPNNSSMTPGPESDETSRDKFDNIDDYNGYAESDHIARDYTNAAITDPAVKDLWRSVTVQYVTMPNQSSTDVNSFARVTVTVYNDTVQIVKLDRIVCRED
jgi:type II secretory pathway pseudopilin PulG